MENNLLCYRVLGLAVDEDGNRIYAGMKTNIPVSAVLDHEAVKYLVAGIFKLQPEDMTEIPQKEYDADYGDVD